MSPALCPGAYFPLISLLLFSTTGLQNTYLQRVTGKLTHMRHLKVYLLIYFFDVYVCEPTYMYV